MATDGLHPLAHTVIDGLRAHVAVLDEAGRVIAVNRRWRWFGRNKGAASDYVGVNYLEVCARAADGGDQRAGRVGRGLDRLLTSRSVQFGQAYVCAERIFRMRARRVQDRPARIFVAHEDITALLRARVERDMAFTSLEETQRSYLALVGGAYEELGQLLAAISVGTEAVKHSGSVAAGLATIRLAVDEARRQVRLLRTGAERLAGQD